MDQTLPWAKAFGLTDDQIKAWQQELPEGRTLISWCIEKSYLDEGEYLKWASQHYNLPLLNESFFEQNKPPEEIIKRYSNIWPDHIAPVSEWDGSLFLACLEPTQGFQVPQPHQWVLAKLSLIAKWKGLEIAEAEPGADLPGIDLDTNVEAPDFSLDLEDIGEEQAMEEVAPLEAPVGLGDAPIPEAPTNDGSPTGLDFGSISTEPVTDTDAVPLQPEEPSLLTPITPIEEEAEELVPLTPMPPVPQPEAAQPQVAKPLKTLSPETQLNEAAIAAPAPPPPPTATTTDIGFAQPSPPPPPSQVGTLEDVPRNIFSKMKPHFDKCMILLFSNNDLEPWRWEESWAQDQTRQAKIDLSTPSIFRIVNESRTPYHGYIVPNPINESFFQTWNQGEYPGHVTIAPLLFDKSVMGMLLGITSKDKSYSIDLTDIEALAEETANLIIEHKNNSAA